MNHIEVQPEAAIDMRYERLVGIKDTHDGNSVDLSATEGGSLHILIGRFLNEFFKAERCSTERFLVIVV